MLIFDRFETFIAAAMFAQAVLALDEDREVVVTAKRLDELCLFPFTLAGVMVYVSRTDDDEATSEDELERMAGTAGGTFAGT